MKSSSASGGTSTSPRSRSTKRVFSRGIRKRMMCGSPPAMRPSTSPRSSCVAGARVEKPLPLLLRLGALRVEQLRRAEAGVGVTALDQLVRARHVPLEVLGLQERPFVPGDAEPAQGVLDLTGHGVVRASAIGVLDAQDQCAAELAAEQPVVDRGACAADVEIPGRRRRETDPHRGRGIGAHVGFQSLARSV